LREEFLEHICPLSYQENFAPNITSARVPEAHCRARAG
jgi:hypothetical protein